jgi:excisionase family DNA binding protein
MTATITFSRIGAQHLRINATLDIHVSGLDQIWLHPPGDSTSRGHASESSQGNDPWELLTVEETAETLHIGRDEVYHLIRTGQLRSIKIGNSRRISRSWVTELIGRAETRSDPHSD